MIGYPSSWLGIVGATYLCYTFNLTETKENGSLQHTSTHLNSSQLTYELSQENF